jgi:glucose-1-phosphate adenylyltransferase
VPVFNLYEEFWKIYTKSEIIPPQYIAPGAYIEKAIISEGAEIYGQVYNSVIGPGVVIGEGSVVRDSIIMTGTRIGKKCEIYKSIIAENCTVGNNVKLGVGEESPNVWKPSIYCDGLVTVAEGSSIPDNVSAGKNTAICGTTEPQDYPNNWLPSGENIIKAGELN